MSDEDSDEDIVEYMLDQNGFLVDKDMNPVLGDDGKQIQLDDMDLDVVKQNGMYEEIESSFIGDYDPNPSGMNY